jgi:hypothetical protein
VVQLPKNAELLQPVSNNPDNDIFTAERFAPSPEQRAAQKGADSALSIIEAGISGMDLKNTPCLVVNFTGYVEDVGVAVHIRPYKDLDLIRPYKAAT